MQKLEASILVVDDDELNRELLMLQLGNEGYTMTEVAGGQEAIDLMALEYFDLVLLDINMPDVDGYEVLQHIQQQPKLKDRSSVMMISASGDRDTVIKCIGMGAEDYLVKPFNMPVVKSRIWRSLHNRLGIPDTLSNEDKTTNAHILLVDDQDFNLDLLKQRLERLDYKVSTAENGEDALSMLDTTSFDLVLLDIMMPGISGYEVLDKIRANEATRHIPVVMVSALDDAQSVKTCIEKGADDYLMKPINSVLLKSRIKSCLSNKRQSVDTTVVV